MFTSASIVKRPILPRFRSLTRGCATPSSSAASTCVRSAITSRSFRMSWARTFRFAASDSENPRSAKTLPAARVMCAIPLEVAIGWPLRRGEARRLGTADFAVRFWRVLVLIVLAPPSRPDDIVALQDQCLVGGLLRLLLEGVQDIDLPGELRHDEHAMLNASVNPYLNRSRTHNTHRLPVIRITSFLKLAELKASFSPRLVRKGSDILESGATPRDGFDRWL